MTDQDRLVITEYFEGKVAIGSLTATQAKIKDRLDYCDNLLRSGKKDKTVATQIMQRFNVGISTAYQDILQTKTIHKSISQLDKDYEKIRLLDMNLHALEWAKETQNLKEYNLAIVARMKILGLDKEDPKDGFDPTLLQQNIFNVVLNEKSGPKTYSLDTLMNLPVAKRTKLLDKMTVMLLETDVQKILDSGAPDEMLEEEENDA
jgi:hypothetical protein